MASKVDRVAAEKISDLLGLWGRGGSREPDDGIGQVGVRTPRLHGQQDGPSELSFAQMRQALLEEVRSLDEERTKLRSRYWAITPLGYAATALSLAGFALVTWNSVRHAGLLGSVTSTVFLTIPLVAVERLSAMRARELSALSQLSRFRLVIVSAQTSDQLKAIAGEIVIELQPDRKPS
jgi:hypothetical protein